MIRWLEIDALPVSLRFTLLSVLRAQDITSLPVEAWFTSGTQGLLALFYAALCTDQPRLTLSRAADLLSAALRQHPALIDVLLRLFCDSGFDASPVTWISVSRLLAAAARLGFTDAEALLRTDPARIALLLPPAGTKASDEASMKRLFRSMAERKP